MLEIVFLLMEAWRARVVLQLTAAIAIRYFEEYLNNDTWEMNKPLDAIHL